MDDNLENNTEKRKNRKKRKSFLMNAKKYGKQGRFGHGSQLTEDTYQYFVRVLETYKEGFPNDEEKLLFANNVFEQMDGDEINTSCNQIGCRVIETLLPFANNQNLDRFIEAFSSNLRQYLSDKFASHVLQNLFSVCCKISLSETDEELKTKYKQFAFKISKFLLNNLEDFVDDTYANHIIRSVFESFAGIPKTNDKKNDNNKTAETNNETVENMPEEYTEIIEEYANRLICWPHFKDLCYHELTSGMLQVLLIALKKINMKLLKKVLKKLLEESFAVTSTEDKNETNLCDVFESKPALMMLETAITVASTKMYTQIYAKCFINNLVVLAKRKDCNFAVQKLLNSCTEKTEFEAMFDELSDSFDDILVCGHTGVILSIAQACKRLATKQGYFVQALMKALHCAEPQERQNEFVPAVARLIHYERLDAFKDQHYYVSLHGSHIIQVMLDFNKPIKIVNSLLSMKPDVLTKLFSDMKGSHIIDSYMKSQYVGEKSREKLIHRMRGTYQDLAVSKHGSQSLEAIWNAAHEKQRIHMMDELSDKDNLWTNKEYGKIIAFKFNVALYKRNRDDWRQFIGKTDKTKLFSDIVDEKL